MDSTSRAAIETSQSNSSKNAIVQQPALSSSVVVVTFQTVHAGKC